MAAEEIKISAIELMKILVRLQNPRPQDANAAHMEWMMAPANPLETPRAAVHVLALRQPNRDWEITFSKRDF